MTDRSAIIVGGGLAGMVVARELAGSDIKRGPSNFSAMMHNVFTGLLLPYHNVLYFYRQTNYCVYQRL